MLLEVLSSFKGVTPFKSIVLDDKWDQINRCYMFLLSVVFGTVGMQTVTKVTCLLLW